MKTYEKTYNLFERFKEKPNIGRYDTMKYYDPIFGLFKPGAWRWFEKLDGMNMRVMLTRSEPGFTLQIGGRTDRAEIPGDLMQNIMDMVAARTEKLELLLAQQPLATGVTLYGEGIGPGIQKGGGYCEQKLFVTFDIAVVFEDGQYYLPMDDMLAHAKELDILTAPELFEGQGVEAVQRRVRAGMGSEFARQHSADGVRTQKEAEGVIGIVPGVFYYNGGMRRIKCKIKTKDFPSNL